MTVRPGPIGLVWLGGGVAQLGEHLLCKQGVIGSIPIVSISADPVLARALVVAGDGVGSVVVAEDKRSTCPVG